ncbi:MAG TPA: hypothetical protein VMA13_03095 [Candidatus Saccharimonadales bacterium]|nr:hypothetical protein [Candidatus Saccharimonadales bacterium]
MTTFSAKPIRLGTAICAFLLVVSSGASAAEQQFADDNCAITFPDDWHVLTAMQSRPNVMAAYTDAAGTRIVILQAYNQKPTGPDASADPGIQQVIGSFRFIHPFVPSYAPDAMAFQIGKLTGVLMVIIVVAVLVFRLRSNSNGPAQPPPLPPGAH